MIKQVRDQVFYGYLNVSLAYHDETSLGEVVNDLTTDLVNAVSAIFAALSLLGFGFLVFFYLGMMMLISSSLTIAALLILVASASLLRRLIARTQETGKAVTAANRLFSTFVVERLRNIRLVRLSNRERIESDLMKGLTGNQQSEMVKLGVLMAKVNVLVEPIVVAVGFSFLYLGVGYYGMTIEELGLFLLIILRVFPVVKELLNNRQAMLGAAASVSAVTRRLEEIDNAKECKGGSTQIFRRKTFLIQK